MIDRITLPRATVQQALELLQSAHVATALVWPRHDCVEALKAALEQPNADYERGFVDGMSEQVKRSVDRAVNHMADALEQPVAWVITEENINSLQVTSIQRLIDRLKHAHHTDLRVRINGQDEWFQADWIKHLQRTHPPRREWRSLSEEEILPLYSTLPNSHAEMLEFARAIEAALKERNV